MIPDTALQVSMHPEYVRLLAPDPHWNSYIP